VIRRNNTVVFRFLFPLVSSFIPIMLIFSGAQASDAKKGAALAQGLCAACHASDGNSVIPANPILAGQHYTYLKNQLNYFQVKEGEDKAKRENAVMLGIASGLSSDDIDNLSAYYSQQKIRPSYASNIELAKELKISASTVSRILRSKYIQTPKGAVSMKSLLASSVSKTRKVTPMQLMEEIQKIINEEKNKLSDQKISDLLNKRGFNLARRTITKYRKKINLPSSRNR